MKALVYTAPHKLDFRDVEDPIASEPDVIVRIEASGICGSDMHAYLGHDERRPAPLILGHEAAGTIADGPRNGQRVVINPLVACGNCTACRQGRTNLCPDRQIISMPPRAGAFAQLVAMPMANLVTVPENVAFEKAALTEPLACGWHAVRLAKQQLSIAPDQSRALVMGGGAIGVGAALALRAQGFPDIVITEGNAARRETIATMGHFETRDPRSSSALPDGAFDIVVDAVGFAATRASACATVKPGGIIVHIGLGEAVDGLDIRRMTLQEITFIGTYTYTDEDFAETASAIFDGRMGALDWMDTRPLSDGAKAFEDIKAGRVAAPKIVLKP